MKDLQASKKVTLTVDRRLLLLVSAIAIYGVIQIVRGFEGVDTVAMSDTFLSRNWPEAGGQVRLRVFEWWGLKRVEYVAESQFYVDDDDPEKTKQKRWMIIDSTGPKVDGSGVQRFPWPLFYVSDDTTYFGVRGHDLKWFNFRRVEENRSSDK